MAQARRRRALHHLERVRNRHAPAAARSPRPLAAGVVIVSLAAGAWCADTWLSEATLDSLAVQGARRVPAAEIARASGLAPGTPLADLDGESVAARLGEHAWVRQARLLPLPTGRLLLQVEEREPVAVLEGEPPRAVDAEGTPFAPASEAAVADLPRLVARGPRATGEPDADLARAAALARLLPARGLPAPEEIGVAAPDDPEGLWLRLPGLPARFVLGRDDLDARLADLARLLEAELPDLATAGRVDLLFRHQAALDESPSPEGTAPAAASRGNAAPSKPRPTG
jgi:cell division protein FtsQ